MKDLICIKDFKDVYIEERYRHPSIEDLKYININFGENVMLQKAQKL